MRGCGSGYRSSSRFISSHDIHARCERRLLTRHKALQKHSCHRGQSTGEDRLDWRGLGRVQARADQRRRRHDLIGQQNWLPARAARWALSATQLSG